LKKAFLIILLAFPLSAIFAQKDSADRYVNNFVNIPPIAVNILPDSARFTNDSLRKGVPFVLMFFNPDCEHCQKETKELLAYRNELKDIQILMISPASFAEIRDFYQSYGLSSMPNLRMGQDLNYKLGMIYKLRTYPSMFVYDNRGTLAKAFVGNIGIPAILDAVK
jgi:thiol-disulfide isomerase/thioredoxin